MKIVTSVHSDPTWTLPAVECDRLREQFPHLTIVDAPSADDRLREIPDAEVAFLSQLRPEELAAAGRLRWIQSPAAGVHGLLSALRASRVVVTNARGIHGDAMAEHVIGTTILLFRNIHTSLRRQVEHRWEKDLQAKFRMLRGSRMAVIGLGSIGGAVAERAAAMGMEVVAVRRNVAGARPASVAEVYPPAELDGVLARADVVVLTAPMTAETRGMIGREQVRAMKRDAILINVSRGKLVKEDELAAELARGTIAGAALDVFDHEPLDPASPLWDLPNVVITPHTSAFREDYWRLAVDLFASNLARYQRGEPLVNVVDKEAGY